MVCIVSVLLLAVLGILGLLVGFETPVLDEWRAEYPIFFFGVLPRLPVPLLLLMAVSGIFILIEWVTGTKWYIGFQKRREWQRRGKVAQKLLREKYGREKFI